MTIASLVVDIYAKTASIETGIEKVNRGLDSVASTATKMAGVLAATFTVTAMVAAGKQVIDYAGRISDLSDRLHVNTTTLQEWEAAFGKSGVSIDTVAKASSELANKIIGGDKSAVGALQKMGFSLLALKAMSPEDRFNKVADAVGRLQDAGEQIYASKTLFGKGGVELLSGLDGHLEDTIKKFDAMGLILDEKTIKAADDFGDKLGFMGKQLLAIVSTVIGPLLPALSALGSGLMWLGQNVIGPVLNVAVKSAITLLAGLWGAFAGVFGEIVSLGSKIPGLGSKFAALSDWLKGSSKSTTAYIQGLWTGIDAVAAASEKAAPKMLGLGEAAGKSSEQIRKEADEMNRLLGRITALNQELAAGVVKPETYNIAKGYNPELDRIRAIVAGQDAVKNMGSHMAGLDPQTIERAIAGAGAVGIESIGLKLEPTIYTSAQSGWSSAVSAFPKILQQAFTGGGGLKGAFNAFTSLVGSSFGEGLFNAGGALNKIGGKLTGMFGSAFGLALPGIGSAIGSLIGPLVSKIAGLFSSAEKQVNPVRQQFIDAAGGLATLNHRALRPRVRLRWSSNCWPRRMPINTRSRSTTSTRRLPCKRSASLMSTLHLAISSLPCNPQADRCPSRCSRSWTSCC